MADGLHDLFVYGEDFEAILDILEEDEAISEQFETAVRDVSRKCTYAIHIVNKNLGDFLSKLARDQSSQTFRIKHNKNM